MSSYFVPTLSCTTFTAGQVTFDTDTGTFAVTGSNAIDFDVTTGISFDADAASNFSTSVGNLTLEATAASVVLNCSGDLQFNPTTAIIDAGTSRITNTVDPTGAQDVATKNYVDSVAQGLSVKDSVRAATDAALAAVTYANGTAGVGATLTADANGAMAAVDGVTLVADDKVLIKDQAAALENGMYTVTQVGDGSNPFILTRMPGNNEADEFAGAFTFVQEGTTNSDTGWVCTTNNPVTVGTTAINFSQFSGAGVIAAGAGLTKTGDTINMIAGDTSLTINADESHVNLAHAFTWTGQHDFDGLKLQADVTGSGVSAIQLTASSGGIDIDAGKSIDMNSAEATTDAIRLFASDAAGGIDIDAGTGGVDVTSTGGITLTSTSNLVLAPATNVINASSSTISNILNPTVGTDAANKAYVDNVAQGLSVKDSAVAATTAALAAVTYDNGTAGVGATLTADANGVMAAVDGVTLAADERLVVKDQAAGLQNGVYVVTDVGTGGTPFILTRSTDMDEAGDFSGSFLFIQEGTTNSDTGWVQTSDSVTVGTTAIAFTQFSGAGAVVAGAGMTKSGDTLNVVAGDTSITVAADELHVNLAHDFVWTGEHDFNGSTLQAIVTGSGSDAIKLSAASGGIDIDASTLTVDTTGAMSLDAAAASTISITTNSGSDTDLTLNSVNSGAGSGRIVLKSESQVSQNQTGESRVRELSGGTTTNATTTTIATLSTATDTAYFVTTKITARRSDNAAVAIFSSRGFVKNDGGTVSVSTPDEYSAADAAASAWTNSLEVSGTDVNFRATGTAATTINWTFDVEWVIA